MSRKVTIASKELRELLEKRNKLVQEGRKEDAERQRLEESINKKGLELQKIDGKATKLLTKKNIKLERDLDKKVWEEITSAGLEDGKIVIQVSDKFVDYANAIKKAEEEAAQKSEDKEDK